jgi:regulation of enolase protein 1 (concanavalin A-like superfamily)
VASGASLAPGGTLTLKNALSLAGNSVFDISKAGTALTGDQVTGVSTLTCGGTLTVNNTGDALTAGDSFTLFTAVNYSGAFSTLTLPTLSGGLFWDTSKLTVNGSIKVIAAPVANNQNASTPEDTVDNLVLTATDADSTNLTYAVRTNPAHGSLSGLNPNTGAVDYTPASNYNGADSFTFTVSDGMLSSTGTVSLTVTAVNDAPVANNRNISARENTATNLVLTGSDIDSANLTYAVLANPAHGGLSGLNPSSGAITYTPATDYYGSDSFTFTVSDGSLSSTGTVNITVAQVLVPPTIVLTTPTNNAVYTLPVTIDLAASVTTNDATVNKVQFYWNATNLIGEVTAAPYTYAWTNAARGSYTMTARLVYNTTGTLDSAGADITILGLPPPWLTADIGSGIVAGSASESNNVYTVSGAGSIGGTADNYRFVYQTLSGDGEIRARLPSFQSGTNADIGVMMRDSLTAGSKEAFMGINGSGSYYSMRRTNTGGNTSSTASGSGTAPNVWVRLVRTGNSVAAYKSANGTNWTAVNTATVTMATNCYFGLCAASGATNTLNTSTFDSLTVTP